MELEAKILNNTIQIFNEKGFKLTMDDVAKACGISKKTIYTVFKDKDEMFLSMVDYVFGDIKSEQEKILKDDTLRLKERIKHLMSALPESYQEIDLTRLNELKDKYPVVYEKVQFKLETGWESTIRLLKMGQRSGEVRKDINLSLIKLMMESTLERFFQNGFLIEENMTYQEGLNQVVEVLLEGVFER